MDNTVACVAGFVMNEKLAWGKCLYVDDLVTSETMRSRGAGKAMIGLVKTLCQGTGVPGITPGLGDASYDAHRFYDREGFDRSSLHFSITDLSE